MTRERGDVLLVDDQPANLEVLSALLSNQGYRVRAVTSGERALEAAKLQPPECILLDVAMPGMDGFETCRALSQLDDLKRVPVIFITAFGDSEHRLKAFSVGGRDYLTKPFQTEEVLARVETQVRLYRVERELREQNARLVTANAQLEQVATMRSRMSAMLIHDLKSPLTVLGAALTNPDPEFLADARVSFDKILRLVQELLELYRGEHQAAALVRKSIDLQALSRSSVAAARHVARQRGIALHLEERTTGLLVKGDPEQIDRVLSNLLENALKFAPTGGTVRVLLEAESGQGVEAGLDFAVLSVCDDGPGIPPQDLPYVFDPYRQRNDAKNQGGVGLGLSIVQRLTAAHGGRVRVLSRIGVGSEFRILLPLE
jgi:two-component system sensor histidine kinase/response regulator